jgi:hypothetical protein
MLALSWRRCHHWARPLDTLSVRCGSPLPSTSIASCRCPTRVFVRVLRDRVRFLPVRLCVCARGTRSSNLSHSRVVTWRGRAPSSSPAFSASLCTKKASDALVPLSRVCGAVVLTRLALSCRRRLSRVRAVRGKTKIACFVISGCVLVGGAVLLGGFGSCKKVPTTHHDHPTL